MTNTEINHLKQEAEQLSLLAKSISVQNDLLYRKAGEFILQLTAKQKQAEEFFSPIVESAHRAHKVACEHRNLVLDPIRAAIAIVKKEMGDYDLNQRRIREEQERKSRAIADEKEREKREALERLAVKAEEQGRHEMAEALREQAANLHVEAKLVPSEAEKPKGISNRITYSVRVLDKSLVPDEYKIVDEQKLKKLAIASKGLLKVPGIKFVEAVVVVAQAPIVREHEILASSSFVAVS